MTREAWIERLICEREDARNRLGQETARANDAERSLEAARKEVRDREATIECLKLRASSVSAALTKGLPPKGVDLFLGKAANALAGNSTCIEAMLEWGGKK